MVSKFPNICIHIFLIVMICICSLVITKHYCIVFKLSQCRNAVVIYWKLEYFVRKLFYSCVICKFNELFIALYIGPYVSGDYIYIVIIRNILSYFLKSKLMRQSAWYIESEYVGSDLTTYNQWNQQSHDIFLG